MDSSTSDENLKKLIADMKKYDQMNHIDTIPSALPPDHQHGRRYQRPPEGILIFDYQISNFTNTDQPTATDDGNADSQPDPLQYHRRPDAVTRLTSSPATRAASPPKRRDRASSAPNVSRTSSRSSSRTSRLDQFRKMTHPTQFPNRPGGQPLSAEAAAKYASITASQRVIGARVSRPASSSRAASASRNPSLTRSIASVPRRNSAPQSPAFLPGTVLGHGTGSVGNPDSQAESESDLLSPLLEDEGS